MSRYLLAIGARGWMARLALVACLSGGCLRVRLSEPRVVPAAAQEAMSWQRAVELAAAHHPRLRQARAELEAAAHARNEALGAYLPSVDGSLTRKRARTTSAGTADSLALDLDVEQPLFAGGQITGDALAAWRQWQAARWQYRQTSAEVRQALRAAFVELLRADQLLRVNEGIAQRRRENADLIQLRYDAGREHEGSLLRARAIADQAAFEVRQVQRRIDSGSLELGRQLGGTFIVPARVQGALSDLVPNRPPMPDDYVALAGQTPSVRRLISEAEAVKASIVSAQAALWPTATGTFNYGYSGTDGSDLKDDASLGVTVSVPLFRGGRNVQHLLESSADYRAAVEAARSQRDATVADLAARWAAFRDAWELVEVRRAFLEAARKRAEIVRAQYTTGLADFQEFDIAEQELSDAEKAHVQSLADVLTQEANWLLAQGTPLEGGRDGP